MAPLALYIHWPFCRSKCPYCDFNSHVAAHIDQAVWREAYAKEIAHYAALLPGRRISSIFFGGGTPSLMEPKTVEAVLAAIRKHWPLANDIEITLEANPTSVEAENFAGFAAAGVNRLSLGVQSLINEDLKFLGRAHDADQARHAIALAAKTFPRFSFDLIYARKGQTPEMWEKELREALTLSDGHLSLYQLTIEPNTQFATLAGRGEELTAATDDAALMFEMTGEILKSAGLPAYEISNHAKPGAESRHNLTYWHYEDYVGIGPGAHGRYQRNGRRFATEDHRAPDVWLRHIDADDHGIRVHEEISSEMSQREAVMMGLRLTEGIDLEAWRKKFGSDLAHVLSQEKAQRLIKEGFIVWNKKTLRAEPAGLQRLNAVLDYLLT